MRRCRISSQAYLMQPPFVTALTTAFELGRAVVVEAWQRGLLLVVELMDVRAMIALTA
jgi:hypothetical protein